MLRSLCLGSALLSLGCLAAAPAQARPGRAQLVSALKRRLPSSVGTIRTLASRRTRQSTYQLPVEFIRLVDNDGDEDLSRGDQLVVHGNLADTRGNVIGTWEGTLTDSSPDTFLLNLTFRFVRRGTLVVNGAQYPDGGSEGVPVAPISGRTGKMRLHGIASLGSTESDDLTITFISRPR